ncbi:hypothetical protein HPB50_024713 [Hyalomma asiaticum]|uniref:Uncharacterized protein n=1 Tax=Hyalomma asiaticum TaxID=266040 RepID=A0ACB7SYY6_HYAAI|nr:hypothetical protein HPB50_024713 [Hyalomma asiaticum]
MIRFLAVSLFVLFSSVPVWCDTSTPSCETKACTDECALHHGYPINFTVVGTCENDTCRCAFYSYCEEKACADVCLKDYGHKKNMTSLCKGRMCYCYWQKQCVQPECAPLCEERHPDKEMIDVFCKNDVCVCKWREVEFSMCDISARMHCLADKRSKIEQTVTGKHANAMRFSNSIAAATACPTLFRFIISFETRAPNLRQTVQKGDAASVRVVRGKPGKQRRNARVAAASVSTVRTRLIRATQAANVSDTEPSDESYVARSGATRTLKPGATPVGGLEVEMEHPLRGSRAIFVDVESREVKKKAATS